MKLLFERIAVPMAQAGTRGSWLRRPGSVVGWVVVLVVVVGGSSGGRRGGRASAAGFWETPAAAGAVARVGACSVR